MTDKEIIIDGTDVSGCNCLIPDYELVHNFDGSKSMFNACECGIQGCENYFIKCELNQNCIYKQLQHERQEKNELTSQLDFTVQKLEVVERKNEELESEAFTREELIKLQEKQIEGLAQDINVLNKKNETYKQALKEIEEIAKNKVDNFCSKHCNRKKGYCLERNCYPIKELGQILQKVKEVTE